MGGMDLTEAVARHLSEAAAKGELPIHPARVSTYHDWEYNIADNFCWRCRRHHRNGSAISERHADWLQANVTFEAVELHAATAV